MNQGRSRPGPGLAAQVSRFAACFLLMAVALAAVVQAQFPPPARPPKSAAEVASDDADGLPSARRVLARHVEAIGGRDAVVRHSSTYARGTLTMAAAGITGEVHIYAARPNKTLLKVSLAGVGEVFEGFDGTHAWSMSPLTGPMLLEGRQLEEKRFDSEFDAELSSESRYLSVTTLGKAEFDGRSCYKIRLVRKTGGEDIEFYDAATGLKAGAITTRETPMGPMTGTTVETDYRRFGALLHATTVRSRIGPVEQVITIAAVEYDTVPESIFELPAEIRALLR